MSDPNLKKKKPSKQKSLDFFNFVSNAKKPRMELVNTGNFDQSQETTVPAPSDGTSYQIV